MKPTWKLRENGVIYRAIDKDGQTLDWMLSIRRNKKVAKQFFKKVINNNHVIDHRVINVDKNPAFPPAIAELQDEGVFQGKTKLR